MSVYYYILTWSENKPLYLRDSLRRILNASIDNDDINELTLLVKKEHGDNTVNIQPVFYDQTHIPTNIQTNNDYPKLLGLKNPKNISALHSEADLKFSQDGLTVIYGNNGSGKSSYSRIFKKLCWSRAPNIELKTNIFRSDRTQQQVEIKIGFEGQDIDWIWNQSNESHSLLKSIFVFDSECSEVYINKDNPAEYKPVGIDLLESLIDVFNQIQSKLKLEISQYNAGKPALPDSPVNVPISSWYSQIENVDNNQLDDSIQFNQSDIDRKNFLGSILDSPNPSRDIQDLRVIKSNLQSYFQKISGIKNYFSTQALVNIRDFKQSFDDTKQAYEIASNELNDLNTFQSFGTSPWRILWSSAQDFAHSSNMSDGQTFPSNESLDKCVLCQQDLDEKAKRRMLQFEQFVLNDISSQHNELNRVYDNKKMLYSNMSVSAYDNIDEIERYVNNFNEIFQKFEQEVRFAINSILTYLENGGGLVFPIPVMPVDIEPILEDISKKIYELAQVQQNRNNFWIEYHNIAAKEFIFNNKAIIIQYHKEFKYKQWLNYLIKQLNTSIISKKIGDIMTDEAINLQHDEFIAHLNCFNSELSNKVKISKSRTTIGQAFMKCKFSEVSDDMGTILSEGEQRIVSLSNFLAECTIDNKLNSIIFDDPVTSLDTDYRELIAVKLVNLAQSRQIIVLTHDLSFMRLLMDIHKNETSNDCEIIGIDKYDGITGIVTDEIPYLAKNIQERINSIQRILREHDSLSITNAHEREVKLDSARKRFRMLLERSVEEVLSNRTYERFSKNINLKRGNLSSYVVTEESDINLILHLFGKYSITEHDGGISTIPRLPSKTDMEDDIREFSAWKDSFKIKLKAFRDISVR